VLNTTQRTQLRDARTKAGLSIRAAAELVGIDKMTWQRTEAGTRAGDVDTVSRMAAVVGLDLQIRLVRRRP